MSIIIKYYQSVLLIAFYIGLLAVLARWIFLIIGGNDEHFLFGPRKKLKANELASSHGSRERLKDLTLNLMASLRLADMTYVMARVNPQNRKILFMQTWDGFIPYPILDTEKRIKERFVRLALGRFVRELVAQHQFRKKEKQVSVVIQMNSAHKCEVHFWPHTALYFDIDELLWKIDDKRESDIITLDYSLG